MTTTTPDPAPVADEVDEFRHLTSTPAPQAIAAAGKPMRMPRMVEPSRLDAVLHDDGDPLVGVEGIGEVIDLAAYSAVALPGSLPHSLVRANVADRLAAAARRLPDGFGLAIFDGWRPLALQQHLYERAYQDPNLSPGFVTPPSADPATPPPHLTGGAVDVTLTYQGAPLALGTSFDDFTARAHAAALENTLEPARVLRRRLYWTMRSVDFVVIDCEWWHFEFGTRRWAAITGHPARYQATGPTP